MDIISYRGPGAAGGVSSGLESGWKNQRATDVSWWHISEDALKFMTPAEQNAHFLTQIPEPVIKGHYDYCNEFLWPLMHDLPEYASYDPEKRRLYKKFNSTIAQYISYEQTSKKRYFIQDYQMALLPRMMSSSGARSSIFWHIPWPKNVKDEFVEPLTEIALGMLSAESVGFHTSEYTQNFMSFVQKYLGEYSVNHSTMLIYKTRGAEARELALASGMDSSSYILRPYLHAVAAPANATKLIVQPLGIDIEKWVEQSKTGSIDLGKVGVKPGEKFVLSVDRADYTKAVLHRLHIIDRMFEKNPNLVGNVAFVQICGRSRAGVASFDQYWEDCKTLNKQVNDRWRQTDGWQPVRWVENPLSAAELAQLYPAADAMLVNPVRDGLNLTAKEFVACRHTKPGVLLLSPGAGAWHELGQHALAAPPLDYEGTADAIVRALHMPKAEVHARTKVMLQKVEQNPLSLWWKQFVHAANRSPRAVAAEQEALSA